MRIEEEIGTRCIVHSGMQPPAVTCRNSYIVLSSPRYGNAGYFKGSSLCSSRFNRHCAYILNFF